MIMGRDGSLGGRKWRLTWTNTGTNAWDLSFTDANGAAIGAPTTATFSKLR